MTSMILLSRPGAVPDCHSLAGAVFHTARGDIELGPGDKIVLPPRTAHAATVGAQGVRCIEASRPPD
jgi:D-lyxose ketol-isomerase